MAVAQDLLLSWEREKAGEKTLTSSVLQAHGQWTDKATEILDLVEGGRGSLSWLIEVISRSEDTLLGHKGHQWLATLVHLLKSAGDVATLRCVLRGISALLTRIHLSPQAVREFPSRHLPSLFSPLLGFAHGDPELQCVTLPVISKLLLLNPRAGAQFRVTVKSWANEGLLSSRTELSQECSRLLVILYSDQRCELLHILVSGLQWAISQLYRPVLGGSDGDGGLGLGSLSLSPPPEREPCRSAFLLRVVTGLTRTLIYAMIFTPCHAGGSVSVPMAGVMEVVFLGLSIQQHQVTSQSLEALLLVGVLPVIHTAVWNILTAAIRCCRSHLLPYTAAIETCLVQGFTCGETLLAVHRALCAWVGVKRDWDQPFTTSVLTALLRSSSPKRKEGAKDKEPFIHQDTLAVQHSSIRVTSAVVKLAGPSLPPPVAESVWKLPLCWLPSSPPPSLTLALLELLLACVTSAVPSLTPPLPKTLHTFIGYCTHPSAEVQQFCKQALAQCGLIQHPMVPPFPRATNPMLSCVQPTIHAVQEHDIGLLQQLPSPSVQRTHMEVAVESVRCEGSGSEDIGSASKEGLGCDGSSGEDFRCASTDDMAGDVGSDCSSSDEDIEEMMATFNDVSSPDQ